jgi:hypothetical protein
LAIDRTLIQIRERSFLDLLDLALVVLRRRPLALGVAAVAGCAPFAALNAWLASLPDFPAILYFYLLAMEAPWATAPLTIVLGGMMFGDRPSARRVIKTLVRSLVPMFVFQGLLRTCLVVFLVLSPLIPARFAFLNEVILLERGRWRAIFTRTGDLCGERGGELFVRAVAQLLFGTLFVLCFWYAAGKTSDILFEGWTWDEMEWPSLHDARTQFGVWVAIAFFAIVRFLAYIDQRIRLEGWEVELRLRQVGAALEDSERWS